MILASAVSEPNIIIQRVTPLLLYEFSRLFFIILFRIITGNVSVSVAVSFLYI